MVAGKIQVPGGNSSRYRPTLPPPSAPARSPTPLPNAPGTSGSPESEGTPDPKDWDWSKARFYDDEEEDLGLFPSLGGESAGAGSGREDIVLHEENAATMTESQPDVEILSEVLHQSSKHI
jgi:hypothetical protein